MQIQLKNCVSGALHLTTRVRIAMQGNQEKGSKLIDPPKHYIIGTTFLTEVITTTTIKIIAAIVEITVIVQDQLLDHILTSILNLITELQLPITIFPPLLPILRKK